MSNALVPVVEDPSPLSLYTRATDVAGVCGEIVKRTARQIQGRKYVQVEGWQSIAVAYGCIASAKRVERVEGGMRAVGELRRASDGALLATAEGFVGEDEPTWYGGESRGKTLPKRPEFAIRAMAQTRAISRVCRTAFAFVVVMIDGKLATTPAEEMDAVFNNDPDITEQIQQKSANEAIFISPDQAVELEDVLKSNGRSRDKLLERVSKLYGKKITLLGQIKAEDYEDAMRYAQGS